MNPLTMLNKKALGLVEIIIAVLLVVGAGIPILKMVTGSRTETSASVNYLRAVELADEVLEWANGARFSEVDRLVNLSGSIIEDNGSNFASTRLNAVQAEYESWKNSGLFNENLSYSEQYTTAFFYREIEVTPVASSFFAENMLKKVCVTVKWSEGFKPSNLNLPSNRNRQVQLSLLVINDENLLR